MKKYIDIFMKLFNQKSLNKAIEYINFLKSELHKFPNVLSDYLKEYFFPEYSNFLHFLEKTPFE